MRASPSPPPGTGRPGPGRARRALALAGGGGLTPGRAAAWALAAAVVAYLNALGNGFALDDNLILSANPAVSGGRWQEALLGPWWYGARDAGGLWRPVTLGGFAAEWRLWGGSPLGFHAASVAVHALVTLGVLRLLSLRLPLAASLAGAIWFAVHPVHVEAVANVVGRAELNVALAAVAACLVYASPRLRTGPLRGVRLVLLALLYLLGLGSKESGATIPALLLLVEALLPGEGPLPRRLAREGPVFAALAAVFAGYLVLRVAVLGSVASGAGAPELEGLGDGARVLTALTLWPEYLRLLLVPLALSADYAPGVLRVAHVLDAAVAVGALVLAGLGALAWALRARAPAVSVGIAWFFVAVLPVSNLLFAAGILLGERTLYLPSVGAALAIGGAWAWAAERLPPARRRVALALAALGGLALFARTVERNPTWFSTYTVMETLAREHPESALALRTRAVGLERVGDREGAALAWDAVVELQPRHYGFLVEGARFFASTGRWERADSLVVRAVALRPHDPSAHRTRAEHLLLRGDGRGAHRAALEGLARAGGDGALWALVSESYIAKGDFEASLRARRAALALQPGSRQQWERLAWVLEALGRAEEAEQARARAEGLPGGPTPPGGEAS